MIDAEYYMSEGCGIFAVALSRLKPGGTIGIISDNNGESWDGESSEITHVFYESEDGTRWDVKGERTRDEMAADFDLLEVGQDYEIDPGFPPEAFREEFMGDSDKFPLYGTEEDIQEAIKLIKSKPELYGITFSQL